jgi:DHA1 family multidrug resistance protein-like MFS transporter
MRSLMVAIVLVAGFAELAYVIVNISAMPVYIKDNVHLDERWIGVMASAYLVVEGLLKSPFGLLGDRIGRKALIVAGPAVSTFTALATPHLHNPYALAGLRVLDGMGAAALWPSAFSLIGDHVPPEKRATAMSLFNLAYILGIALGPAIGGGINDWAHSYLGVSLAVSKEASFYVAALLFAFTAIIALIFIPHFRAVEHQPTDLGPGLESGFSFRDFKEMLRRMPMMLLIAFVTFLGIGLIMAYVKVFAQETFDLSESGFGGLLILPALLIAAVSVPLGALSDRIGKARAVRSGIGLCALAYWLLLLFPFRWTLALLGTLVGLGFVIAFPAWMALVTESSEPNQRGAVVGAVGTAQGIGAIVGVAASSLLYKLPPVNLGPVTVPAHGMPFLGCGLMLACSFLLALFTVHEPPDAT